MKLKAISLLFLSIFLIASCAEKNDEKPTSKKEVTQKVTPDDGRGAQYEKYMSEIDESDSLDVANSLYYTKNNGESYQVYLRLNKEAEIVRIEEKYTTSESGSLLTNFFYFKDGVKYATKERFIEGKGNESKFAERVTYYDENGPKISKIRRAPFEEYLQNESFSIIPAKDCSDARAQRALRGEGEFATNFVSTVQEEPIYYIIVGEGSENGYVSALVVQHFTPLIKTLLANPKSMEGKPMEVSFQEVNDGTGFTFQALLDLKIAK